MAGLRAGWGSTLPLYVVAGFGGLEKEPGAVLQQLRGGLLIGLHLLYRSATNASNRTESVRT